MLRKATTACLKWHTKVYQLHRWSHGLSPAEKAPVYDILNAGPNHRFQTAAAVAHNCLAVCAGNHKLLDAIKLGYGIYEAHAVGSGMWSGEKGTLKKTDPKKYAAAKAQVLALGYGASASKFMIMSPALTGGDYCPDAHESERAVADFRHRNPEITRLWKRLENGLKQSINRDFELELPSGRVMRYRKITSIGGLTGLTVRGGKFIRTKLYGALCCENLCQGTARDVFAFHMKLLHDEGFDIQWHVHDEVILLADEDKAETTLARALEIMSIPPPWMPRIPLAAEGETTPVYKK